MSIFVFSHGVIIHEFLHGHALSNFRVRFKKQVQFHGIFISDVFLESVKHSLGFLLQLFLADGEEEWPDHVNCLGNYFFTVLVGQVRINYLQLGCFVFRRVLWV